MTICLVCCKCSLNFRKYIKQLIYNKNSLISEPISKAKTLIKYNSGDPDLISFPSNADAIIYMKSAGLNPDIWYANINGQSGFVNSKFLREYKKIAEPEFILPVEGETSQEDVKPDKVKQAHEVVEGTTIYGLEPQASEIQEDTTTPSSVQSSDQTVQPLLNVEQNQQSTQNSNNENTPIQTNIETFLNENVQNQASASQSSDTPEEIISQSEEFVSTASLDKDVIETNSSENNNQKLDSSTELPLDIQNSPQEENSNNSNKNAQIPSEETINQDPETITPDSPIEKTEPVNENPQVQTQTFSESENASVESTEVPNEVDYVNPDLTKSDSSDVNHPNLLLSPNLINTVEAAQTIDKPKILNNNDNTVISEQVVDTPQVPEDVNKDTILASENNKVSILNMNGELGTDQVNIQSDITVSQSAEQQSSTQDPSTDTTQIILSTTVTPELIKETIPAIYNADNILPIDVPNENLNNVNNPSVTEQPTLEAQSTVETTTEVPLNQVYTTDTTPEVTSEASSVSVTVPEQDSDSHTSPTESLIQEIFNTPTTEASHVDENSDNLISSIYTTISDIWSSTTETPPTESIFNPELVQEPITDEQESGSYSFVKYLFYTYNSVMGAKVQSNALFPSAGK